jgi:hypothetical protein
VPDIADLKESLVCPVCELEIPHVSQFQNARQDAPVRKGDVMVCSGCGNVLQLGDSSLRRMSGAEIKQMDKTSQSVLAFLIQGVLNRLAQKRRKQKSGR